MNLHLCTPLLQVIDPRALVAREVAYCRSAENAVAEQRVTRHMWDEAGRSVADWDPRLWENGLPANTTVVRSLSSQVLLNESVDAGWEVRLSGADGQRVDSWDGRGSYRTTEYDNQLRPACVSESLVGQPLRVVERFIYGDAFDASALHNLCGQPIRHDDPAGTLVITDYGLTGTALVQNRRFLNDVQSVDWPLDVTQRDPLLEPGEGYPTLWGFDATGASISQTDAVGNRSLYCYGIDGLLTETRLMSGQSASARSLIHDIRYSAEGQILSERLGNGVVTQNTYESETGRLIRIYASKANGSVLQDLNYQYDPVGNVVAIEDRAQPTRYSANQRIEPVNRYRYDSLYQLIEATGREVSTGAGQSPALPALQNLPLDASQLSNYTQTYKYDAGGNLLQLRHVGAQSFTRNMRVAPNSNRSLSEDDTEGNFEKGFDANGNLQQLVRGQSLHWNLRNQLIRVTAVQHEDGSEDDEVYVYDGAGQRCRKIRTAQAKARILNAEVRYLPGLEIRSAPDGEVLHVATVQAARTGVRLLHWQKGKPGGIDNDQVRYSLNDHLGSCSLELDAEDALISREGYYPFGATAWWAARSFVEAKYKTVRYSGKERDATGLYYYGFRYYSPWLCRWISADWISVADGLNVYAMTRDNPISRRDSNGARSELWNRAITGVMSQVRKARNTYPISVWSITKGIVGVSIRGTKWDLKSIGIALDRSTDAPREISYLAIGDRYSGKVSGGNASIPLSSASGEEISNASGSMPVAYINGGYFNFGKTLEGSDQEYASVGANSIDGESRACVQPPEQYARRYAKLIFPNGSFIHVAPRLTVRGIPAFQRRDSLLDENLYSTQTGEVGALGHAGDPNARSGISLPHDGTALTRIAIGLNTGRHQLGDKKNEPGFTMLEWTTVMTRLDHLNPPDQNEDRPASSYNLDGGDSSALGVLDICGEHLLRVNTGAARARPIGNFISFHARH